MRYSIVGSLLACVGAVKAFGDTSPFLLFSSERCVGCFFVLLDGVWLLLRMD